MCGTADECGCGGCAEGPDHSELMAKMMQAIGVSGLLSPELLATAATRCSGCTDVEPCRDFLAGATLRGADHAPGFCPNASTFDALASEVPTTF